ncbi:MAG: molybdopterin-converting factor chain 1 [Proteobacteria bacterium]|nr:molybdopterin-converting factor chain 1 [Pseudomonadota bacterium]
MARVRLKYYAVLREQAGRGEETVETGAADAAGLFEELAARHGFSLGRDRLRVAVNAEFADWSRTLADGDEIVFIPPVAGG